MAVVMVLIEGACQNPSAAVTKQISSKQRGDQSNSRHYIDVVKFPSHDALLPASGNSTRGKQAGCRRA